MNEPSGGAEGGEKPKKEKHTSARKFFGEEEDVYIMDAKQIGNIGRYLNHSCKPNMFVQNCFVDTHDLRLVSAALSSMSSNYSLITQVSMGELLLARTYPSGIGAMLGLLLHRRPSQREGDLLPVRHRLLQRSASLERSVTT